MANGMSFSEAVAAGQHDTKAEELGGYVVADVGDQQFIHLPTDKPDGALSDIGTSDRLGPNAEVKARYKRAGADWQRLDATEPAITTT